MWGNTFSKYLKLIFSILSYVNIVGFPEFLTLGYFCITNYLNYS